MRALVTGGGGFLGRAIVERLLARGHAVTAVGRHDYPEVAALGATVRRADVTDRSAIEETLRGYDVVFHAAAKAGVWGPRADYFETNVTGTRNVVDACRAGGVAKLVFTSSPSVVFDGRDQVGASNDLPYPPSYESHYPATKAEAERLVLAANGPGLATIALRPHLIYGPRDPHLLPRVFGRARSGRLAIVGDGQNRVSVSYVENAAAAHVQAAEALAPLAACAGRAYFVNDAEPVLLWPWLNDLLRRLDIAPVTRRIPLGLARAGGGLMEAVWSVLHLPGEPPMTRFVAAQLASSHTYSLEPARRDFGFEPPVAAASALDTTVAWWGRS